MYETVISYVNCGEAIAILGGNRFGLVAREGEWGLNIN